MTSRRYGGRQAPDGVGVFLNLLPRTTTAAVALAQEHTDAVDERASTGPVRERPLRHVLEVRHPSFADEGQRWAEQTCAWSEEGRDVLVCFNNDSEGRAPYDAMALGHLRARSGGSTWTA